MRTRSDSSRRSRHATSNEPAPLPISGASAHEATATSQYAYRWLPAEPSRCAVAPNAGFVSPSSWSTTATPNGASTSTAAATHASGRSRSTRGSRPSRVVSSSSARALHACSAAAPAATTSSTGRSAIPSSTSLATTATAAVSTAIASDRSCAHVGASASRTEIPTASALSDPREKVR